jgi:hypothetical protein
MSHTLHDAALDHHRCPTPGETSVNPTRAMAAQRADPLTRESA